MTLRSALEDLRSSTLDVLSGTFRKLEYIAGLQNQPGCYAHWGLSRIHGPEAASKALEQEHRRLVSHVLATPLPELVEELQECSEMEEVTPLQYVTRLEGKPGLLPPNPGAGSALHFSSVLHALLGLVATRRGASRQAS